MTPILIRSACALATAADTTLTTMLPGLALDAISSKGGPPSAESLQKLVKWGKANGGENVSLHTLQSNRWYFAPLEFVRTSSIAAARKTFFSAAAQLGEIQAAASLVNRICALAREHYRVSEGVELRSFEQEVKTTIGTVNKQGSFVGNFGHLTHKYPNTRARHYLFWGIRLGIFYYFSPTNSFIINAVATATCLYAWTILLTPGARKDLASIQPPKEKPQTSLSEGTQRTIIASATRLFSGENTSFNAALRDVSVQRSIPDSFPKSAEDYHAEYQRSLEDRNRHEKGTSEWYQLDWKLRTALLKYYEWRPDIQPTYDQSALRKQNWLEWHAKAPKPALAFIRAQTDVSEEEWQTWLPKERTSRIKPLRRK